MTRRWWIWLGCGALVVAVAWWAVARSGLWSAADTERTDDAGEPQFVGRAVCAECHAGQVAAWAGSDHDRAMDVATDATVLGNFDNARFTHSGVTSVFFRRDGKYFVRTDGPDGKLADFEIRYVFGVDPLQQYLIEMPDGRLQTLSITWDSRPVAQGGGRWYHMYPDEFVPHGDELHWTSPLQNWNYQCAECHSTNLQRSYDPKSRRHAASWSEIDVSCETCHGPGSRHVAWAKDPEPTRAGDAGALGMVVHLDERRGVAWSMDPSSGKPARSQPRESNREIETCARCHSRRGQVWKDYTPGRPIGDTHRVALLDPELYFPDGQIRDEVYEYGSFLQSRMHQAGVSCGDCHDPHSLKLRAPGGAVCLQCHQAEKYQATSHHHHEPESAGSDCLGCHMPGRLHMGVDFRRDHSMRVPRPDLAVALDVPDACTGCHDDRKPAWAAGKLREWFGTARTEARHYGLILHDGDVGAAGARQQLLALAQDSSLPGIVRASALQRVDRIPGPDSLARITALLQDPDPLVRRAAVSAHRPLPPERRKGLLVMLKDAVRDVRLEAVPLVADIPDDRLQPGEIGERDRAIAEYITAQRVNADRADAHLNLALISLARGRSEEARAELEEALVLDPRFLPAVVNLADLHRSLGDETAAEAALRTGLESSPHAAALHHALGLLLVRTGRAEEALAELRLAAEQAPSAARYGFVHAVALDSAGRRPEAIRVLRKVLVQQPNDRDTLWALANWQLEDGKNAQALESARRLALLEPDDPGIRELLDRAETH